MLPPALAVVASEPPESPVCSLALCPRETQSPVLFTGHQDGVVFSWDLSPGGVAPYAYLLGHSAAVVAMVLQPSLQRVVR
jgi:WD40 repeat protein